ncbi:hypothetical protein OSH11_13715 [Kaistia dalseonensis]|uniref:Uncharacterized protein n=1 Tax=Kaistia dalseonensis TaxID=410840 RepID=A0ABU0H7T2_9HYPH|nr:hypothetical protein [Kaistia dalseonensis]MCX5495766.1 hypothetical protein [Kaistia dalseonensis]MDQ0438366.1 hypothetical protein [Kaistia dalseonensis]
MTGPAFSQSLQLAAFAISVGAIGCAGACIAVPIRSLLAGELHRDPAGALLLTVSGVGAAWLGIELLLWLPR